MDLTRKQKDFVAEVKFEGPQQHEVLKHTVLFVVEGKFRVKLVNTSHLAYPPCISNIIKKNPRNPRIRARRVTKK